MSARASRKLDDPRLAETDSRRFVARAGSCVSRHGMDRRTGRRAADCRAAGAARLALHRPGTLQLGPMVGESD